MTPTQKENARATITKFCADAVRNNVNWSYSQNRPFAFVDKPGVGRHSGDCSALVVVAYWNVMHDLKLWLADPSGMKFSGWGNTWSMEAWLRKNGKRITTQGFLVGDIAMYRGHTTICSKKGTAATAEFTSHGGDRDPSVRDLHYRDDLIGVWRHPALL